MTSTIKVDNIQNQCGANIINESSNTITIGASGDTVSLASGASQTGFGRTGTVDWQTSSIKTATFTATNGEGYFCNTSGGAFTVNLPAGSAGAIVSVSDYTRTFQTNNLTVSPNGSEKIGGVAADAQLSTEGQTATFVYVDGTEGWINIQETSNSVTGNANLVATGGTITTSGNFKIHTFTGPGTFTVCQVSSTAADNTVSYVVVAGGASGGSAQYNAAGGGGAGGFREYKGPADCYTASPLDGNPGGTAVTVTAQAYPITVGAGGASVTGNGTDGNNGSNSVFSTVTSTGGGAGTAGNAAPPANPGGSGGGAGGGGRNISGGSGNTPPVSPAQGTNGGSSAPPGPAGDNAGGGGGGATVAGATVSCSSNSTAGGAGATSSINGTPTARAGGGGASGNCGPVNAGAGGAGGGGAGGPAGGNNGTAGTANTGGGGGGASGEGSGGGNDNSGAGGSGIVIIRYKFQ